MKENLASANVALTAEGIAKIDEALEKMNLDNAAGRRKTCRRFPNKRLDLECGLFCKIKPGKCPPIKKWRNQQ